MEHHNIAAFVGLLCPTGGQVYILTESGDKGCLRDLIDNDGLQFNWDLRFSIIWDLISVGFSTKNY